MRILRAMTMVLAMAGSVAAAQDTRTALAQFRERADSYAQLQRQITRAFPEPDEGDESWGMMLARHHAAAELRRARGAAQAGDIFIFIPPVHPIFRERIAAALAGPDQHALRAAAARSTHDAGGRKAAVDQPFPAAALLPVRLILALPELPPELEYRLAGRDLVLWNVYAELVADVLDDVY